MVYVAHAEDVKSDGYQVICAVVRQRKTEVVVMVFCVNINFFGNMGSVI